ncbi:MAG TPA: FecR domain-containing protein [Polyangiaceae bacterium]|jgi:PHD/YefM family antitoxin component YafN of YafNO toxin-antitoxin module|nr:FecR domain-containing protein [Polyangiaceae bacterium]
MPSQPDDMLRRLGSQVVPVEDPELVERRREQVVAALSRSIRASAERKRRVTRGRVLWGMGIAASLALGVGVAARARHNAVEASAVFSTVSEVTGAVVITENGESRVLSNGSEFGLRSQGEIETAPEAQAEIRSKKSAVHLNPASKLTVSQITPVEERYRLAVGRVEVSVDKDSPITRSVVVETPNAEVVVHGTVFAVGVSSRNQQTVTEVSVTRGSVWVLQHGSQAAVLGAGQHWSSDAEPVPAAVAGVPATPTAATPVAPPPAATSESALVRRDAPVRGVVRQTPAEAKSSTLAEQSRMFQEAIDARNRGEDARAVELFARLLSRYPSYEEAEVQLFRAQKRLGRMTSAAAEARRYLALHPQGFARDEARDLALSSQPAQRR